MLKVLLVKFATSIIMYRKTEIVNIFRSEGVNNIICLCTKKYCHVQSHDHWLVIEFCFFNLNNNNSFFDKCSFFVFLSLNILRCEMMKVKIKCTGLMRSDLGNPYKVYTL